MRNLLCLAAVATLGFIGCNKSSPEGGAPATANSFTIVPPTLSPTIKQDNKESVKLTVKRGTDFKQGVKLSVTPPTGIKAELDKSTVAAGDSGEVTLTITVAKDAGLGEQVIKISGTPDSGAATAAEVKVNVTKNP